MIRTSGRLNFNTRSPIQFQTNPWNQQEFDRTGRRTYTVTYTRDNTFEIQNLEAKPSLTPQETLRLEELRESDGTLDTILHWMPDPEEAFTVRRERIEAAGLPPTATDLERADAEAYRQRFGTEPVQVIMDRAQREGPTDARD